MEPPRVAGRAVSPSLPSVSHRRAPFGAELWHDFDGIGFASIVVGEHVEHHLLRSKAFRDRLRYLFYKATKGAPGAQAMEDAIATLEAMARFEGEEHTPAVRIAHHEGNIYVDLADKHWRVVEITPQGWNLGVGSPVRFVRPRGLRPLPVPEVNGAMDDLERFLNVQTEGDLKLVLGWLVMAFNPRGPYPLASVEASAAVDLFEHRPVEYGGANGLDRAALQCRKIARIEPRLARARGHRQDSPRFGQRHPCLAGAGVEYGREHCLARFFLSLQRAQ